MSLWPGYRLGRFRIEGELGTGGQASVYEATDTSGGGRVALKVLSHELSDDPTLRARLRREAEAVAALDHPAIVRLHEAGEDDGRLYLSMALVRGTTLQGEIDAEGGLAPARALAILRRVAAALDHAHGHGMVHRDVKPANILIGEDGAAYLTDFGLAKVAGGARITRTGMWVGTLDYIAPEQLLARAVGPPADLYALAAVAYEALAGRPPFVRSTPGDLVQAHLADAPRPAGSLRASLRPADPVLLRGLAKDPAGRFGSARAFVHALAGALPEG